MRAVLQVNHGYKYGNRAHKETMMCVVLAASVVMETKRLRCRSVGMNEKSDARWIAYVGVWDEPQPCLDTSGEHKL
jgi:hypothetical protein